MENTTLFVFFQKYTDYSVIENNIQGGDHTSRTYKEIGITAVYSVLCLLGTIGNGLVIWFCIFRMKKTVNVMWFLSLAVADFSLAFFWPWHFIQIALGYWPFKNSMCKLVKCVLHINVLISVLQLTVISVDRCICVVFPVWCHNHRRLRSAFIIVLIIWIISLAAAAPSIIYTEITYDSNRTMCLFQNNDSSFRNTAISYFVFLFLLPFIIIVSCYILIFFHARKKRIFASSRPLKTIMAVIIAFFICWFPSRLFFLLLVFERNKFNAYSIYYGILSVELLILMSTCINPILYVFIGQNFKKKFCGSFQARLEKAFMEEDKSISERQDRSTALQSELVELTTFNDVILVLSVD